MFAQQIISNYKQMNSSKTTQLYPCHNNSQPQTTGITKFATLSPYLSQIEKRKKNKSVFRQNRIKSKNQSSSKSFRIKQKSTSSLQSNNKKQLTSKTILSIINKVNAKKKQLQNKSRNVSIEKQKSYNPPSSFTLKSDHNRTFSRNDAIDIRDKKHKKQLSFRKNKYQVKSRNEDPQTLDQNKQTIQFTKYGKTQINLAGFTDTNRNKKPEEPVPQKETENLYAVGRKKFRRGKYQALYSSVNSNDILQQKDNPTKSQSLLQITKKQSNLSINKQADMMAQKQMQRFYRQMRSKQIRNSLEKSTQKYFKQDRTYRTPKTNNDIEIYVSTVKNPMFNRQSNASTLNTSEQQASIYVSSIHKTRENNNLLNYDFDFKEAEPSFSGITEIDNPSQEESMHIQEETSFQKQRKQVQKQYFHKKSPQIDWSEQDCQIDEV